MILTKRVLILVSLLLCVDLLKAQELRLSVGANVSRFSKTTPGFSTKVGGSYFGGIELQLRDKKKFYIQPGLQYISTNTTLSHPLFSDAKSNLLVSGIKVPIMVGKKFILDPSTNLRVFMGPSFMAILKVNHKNMTDTSFTFTDKNYHDIEWAWHIGTGLDVGRYFIDVGFQKGLTYVFTGGPESKSNNIYLAIGIRNFKRKKVKEVQ